MKPPLFPLSTLARACAASLLCGTFTVVGSQAIAATTAGTEIKNLATVTYEDAAGNTFSAQSNEAVVTVAQVYFATIGTDVDVTGSPGQTVYLPYVLTNTGNGSDTYNLSAVDGITGGDTLDAASITIYRDANGNGQPDAGEPAISSLDLAEAESADLVVAVQIPTTAVAAENIGITLTAEALEGTPAAVAQSVEDVSANGGRDTLDGTVESLITVTDDAVLVMTKTSSHDIANNEITYTVTVTNNGNTTAQDVVIFDGLPAQTTFVSGSVSGLLGTNGDTLLQNAPNLVEGPGLDFNGDGTVTDSGEPLLGIDLNNDGDTADTLVPGVYAVDSELAPNATVSMTFTVSYDPVLFGGGNTIDNIAYLSADTNGDGTVETLENSNLTSDEVVQSFAVSLDDTGVANPSNSGGDDDATINDTQTVSSAASGGTVLFDLIVTNNGNGDDTFELTVDPGTFPTGTVFTFLDATGAVQLTDTNGAASVDSGVIAQNGTRTIQVRAKLPQGASGDNGGAGFLATVTATSAVNPSSVAIFDTADIQLDDIVAASADIHASTGGTIGADEDPLGTAPFVPVATLNADAGSTVNIPVLIDNESSDSDSYQLFAGSSFDGTNVGALPTGWNVQFFLDDGNGNPTGPAITSTPTLPGGTTDFALVAVVTLAADAALSAADVLFDANGDGTATSTDQNGDGDGDYPLFMQIISANSGATDTMLQAVDVNAGRAVAFTPSLSNQVEPGGTVEFPASLDNTGNSEETVELTTSNSQPGFINTVTIDTNGDGIADTVLGNLTPGTIMVQQDDGTVAIITVENADGDADPELVLPPGVSIPLVTTVFAPANAPAGQVDTMTLVATNVDTAADAPDAEVSFQSDVITGQVRLTKTAAIDTDCDGTADSSFESVQTVAVEPEQCVIWRVVAENQGDVDANNVIITDSVTAFSAFEAGTLAYCLTSGCAPAPVTDAQTDDAGGLTGSVITFYAGTGANPAAGEGGILVPGEQATAQFSVRVE